MTHAVPALPSISCPTAPLARRSVVLDLAAAIDTADFPWRRASVAETLDASVTATDRESQVLDTSFGIAA